MRFKSKKRAAEDRLAKAERQAYLREFPRCQICGVNRSTEIHEICRGPARRKAYGMRVAWLALCRTPCHDDVGDYSIWPLARQYARKKLVDGAFYNRVILNRLRGRADNAITEEEVNEWM